LNNDIINYEKALLIGVINNEQNSETLSEHLDELKLLAETAGAIVVGKIYQKINKVHSQYFVGRGKALQIIEQAKELKVNLIIFDDELTPSQIKNFLKLAKEIKIIDRNGLILDIFSKHAKTRESKTQVELAHLEYMLPRLTKQWSHLERQMGGIGTRAGMGESQIEIDRRLIRQRISKLKKELIQIEKERKIQSKMRNNKYRVSLVGYTNAGKSSLMKCLSGENVYIQNQLFATLDTTIRRVDLDKNHSILLSDTVGFIRKLPHDLVASFKSTLFEVIESNLILIVLDASSNQIKEHMYTINNVLTELESEDIKTVIILNKIDLIKTKKRIKFLKTNYPNAIMISATDHLRINKLINRIITIMNEEYEIIEISFPYTEARQISLAQRDVEVLDRIYQDDRINLKIKGPKEKIQKILNQS
jgi:GTP-binding protein HflX|tara:strand:+ start:3702 stop:4961 length:1260 start_codon:yes stop_codon:yes gene_type:complete